MSAPKGMGAGTSCAWCTENCNECQVRHNRSAVMAEAFRMIAQCCLAERCEDDSAELADTCCECPAAEACDKYINKRECAWSESIRVPMSEAAMALSDAFNTPSTNCVHGSCAYNADGVCRYALVTGSLPERMQGGKCLANTSPEDVAQLRSFTDEGKTGGIPMNFTLLSLIILVQRCKAYSVAKNILFSDTDWWKDVENLWKSIPHEVFEKSGIAQNRWNLEEALRFDVTEGMRNAQAEDLGKFKVFGFCESKI